MTERGDMVHKRKQQQQQQQQSEPEQGGQDHQEQDHNFKPKDHDIESSDKKADGRWEGDQRNSGKVGDDNDGDGLVSDDRKEGVDDDPSSGSDIPYPTFISPW